MRKGTVVYLAGTAAIPVDVDIDLAVTEAGYDPRWTEVAGLAEGFNTPEIALLELARRGAGRVDIARAFYEEGHGLTIEERPTRLLG